MGSGWKGRRKVDDLVFRAPYHPIFVPVEDSRPTDPRERFPMKFVSVTRLWPAVLVGAMALLASFFTRFALSLRPDNAVIGWSELSRSFALGTVFDFVTAVFFVTPFVLWLALAPRWLSARAVGRASNIAAFYFQCFGLLFLAVAEWLFWDEFGGRFNFIAVDYLLYSQEVIGNIWESYPVGRLLIAIALLAAALTAALARPLWRWSRPIWTWRAGIPVAVAHLSVCGFLAIGMDSDMKVFSGRDAANELAGNGLFEFFSALRRNELSYERYYSKLPLDEAIASVRNGFSGARWTGPKSDGTERIERGHGSEKHLNVVLISIESMGAEFLGAYGDGRGLTPNLDRIAADSLWFSRVYATGNRTVRGLEALSLALPPTPGQSIVRRPNNEKLFSLGSVFEDKGYQVLFAYGGYGYFDNMNAFFDANDYRVIDRRAIPNDRVEFENIWGVADEHLFTQVIDEIDRGIAEHPDKPVFAHVMTTSNHRPYTYPAGRIDIPSGSGREGAVKYTDYAIGRLVEGARGKPWFRDTVFVITADHGASARGTSQIPLDKYRIPLLVYSPAHVQPRRIDRLMSQIDLAPTVLGLLDFSYYSKFLGRDLLHSPPESDRAFVANFQTLGFMKGDRIAVLRPKQQVDVYRLHADSYLPLPGGDAGLSREAIAFYQVASHVFRNGLYDDNEQHLADIDSQAGAQVSMPSGAR
jgi:phosphoglycerol transferase MdoB-like AlkP superfamily enzyme